MGDIRKNGALSWNRLISCAALSLYVCALVVMPAVHGHSCEHQATTCCEHHSESDSDLPVPEDTCSLCEFVRLAIPFVVIDLPVPLQAEIGCDLSFTISIPSVADAAILPPCRAPPAV